MSDLLDTLNANINPLGWTAQRSKYSSKQVELRFRNESWTTWMLVYSIDEGYTWDTVSPNPKNDPYNHHSTKGQQIRMSMNGVLRLSHEELATFPYVIEQAHTFLEMDQLPVVGDTDEHAMPEVR